MTTEPLILLVPGLNNSGPAHWQSQWEAALPNASRAELSSWDAPRRFLWMHQIDRAVRRAARAVLLVAHSLGCHAVASWAEHEQVGSGSQVLGALLVAPPDVEKPDVDPRLARFAPVNRSPLPFPSILVASRDDTYIDFGRAKRLARIWKSRFVDAGWLGHINAESRLQGWPFGRFLLRQLQTMTLPPPEPLLAGRAYEAWLASRGGAGAGRPSRGRPSAA